MFGITRNRLALVLSAALLLGACATGAGNTTTSGATTTAATAPSTTAAPATTAPATTAPAAAEPITLTFWNYWDGKNGEVLNQLAEQYTSEHPGVTIESVFVGWGDLLPKLQTAVAGGDTPDIAAGDLVWMPKLTRTGILVPLDEYIQAAGVDLGDFYPEMLRVGQYQGHTYSLPVSTNNLELFYNKELFSKAGLDPDTPPTSWSELSDMAAQCTDPSSGVSGLELFTEPGEGLTWQFQVYLWQAGGQFLSDDLTKAAFNSPAGEKALNFWVDEIDNGSAPVAPWGQFGQGKACMVMDGSWMVGIWSSDPPFDFGTAQMPYPSNGQPATNMGGEQIFLFPSDAARQQAAFDFVSWLTGTDAQITWDSETGFGPVRKSVAASDAFVSHVRNSEPRMLPFIENQKYAHSRPPIANYPEVSDAFSEQIERALLGESTPQQALAAAEAAVNKLLGGS
ncbi:MAG: ABC transporter substrate-binding protein [Actinobacteria bacterium]|nr:ABC transporter substrate-binding protein [Actinomycetota bacterium]